ncbi:hypothetical protein LZC95_19665 [Pendulispora brunnea]|uniref:Uncharacterized protein n=1 Tax=Pendulispora brunnea TaxID=2905690 RepID=A0ABZ2KKH2_9BACT
MNNELTNNESTNVLLKRAVYDVEQKHAVLVGDLREFAKLISETADRLEDKGVDADVNPDGIVQGRGAAIDVACARFMDARRHLGLVRRATSG